MKTTQCVSIYDMWGNFKGYKNIKVKVKDDNKSKTLPLDRKI